MAYPLHAKACNGFAVDDLKVTVGELNRRWFKDPAGNILAVLQER